MSNQFAESQSSQDDVSTLQQRVAELETRLAEWQRIHIYSQHESEDRLQSILNSLEDIVWSQSPTTFEVLYLNPATELIYGRKVEEFLSNPNLWVEVIHPDDFDMVFNFFPSIVDAPEGIGELEYRIIRPDGEIRWLHDRGRLIRDPQGEPLRIDGIATDITDRKKAEAEYDLRRRQEEQLRAQELLLHELSTPLIPISDDVMIMPLIGAMDERRAQQMTETLLEGIVAQGIDIVIIDITGVSVIDSHVANMLIQAAKAIQLVGAQVVMSGMRPDVAQALVTLQIDFGRIRTDSTLQASIAFALSRTRRTQRQFG